MIYAAWLHFVRKLKAFPQGIHKFCDKCPEERILDVEREFGKMPDVLAEMVRTINGGELFINTIPFVTLFGISPLIAVPNADWPSEWYIDNFTRFWRLHDASNEEWAFAMTNYGGLMLMDRAERVREWDTEASSWGGPDQSFDDWLLEVREGGNAYLTDEA